MSIKVMTWAWEQELPPLTKLVLMAIADHCDDEGYAWPGIKGISKKCGVAHRTVQRQVEELQAKGILNVEARQRPDGSSSSNGYTVVMDGTKEEGVAESHPPMSGMTPPHGTDDTPLTVIEPSDETTTTTTHEKVLLNNGAEWEATGDDSPLTLLEVFNDPEWLTTLADVVTPTVEQRNRIMKWARNHEVAVLTQVAYSAAESWAKYKTKNKSLYNTFMNWVNMQEKRDAERGAPAEVLPRSQQNRYGAEAYIQNQGLHPSSEEAKKIRREWSNGST